MNASDPDPRVPFPNMNSSSTGRVLRTPPRSRPRSLLPLLSLLPLVPLLLLPATLSAQPSDPAPTAPVSPPAVPVEPPLSTIEVVGNTPLPGTDIGRDEMPASVQSITRESMQRWPESTLAERMNREFTGAYVNEAQANPFQPDFQYRGFLASPLLGTPIGLSVYVDGVRVNEAFGDTVLWDLLPSFAIDSMHLIPGSNPLFGLNTLGGSLNLRTRNGRNSAGARAMAEAGSYGHRGLSASHGFSDDSFDTFVSAELLHHSGWREHTTADVRRFFGKTAWSDARTRVELSYTHVENQLVGTGLVPESRLEGNRHAVYAWPEASSPKLDFLSLNGRRELAESWNLSALAYVRRLRLDTAAGDIEYDIPEEEYEAEYRRTRTAQMGHGASVQLARDGDWWGRRHRFAAGLSLDLGRTRFSQSEQRADLMPDREVVPRPSRPINEMTRVQGRNRYIGLFVTDTVTLAPGLLLSVGARHTQARVALDDESGSQPALNGSHSFSRTNPSIGLTWQAPAGITLFGSYHEGFRVPSPVELACADPGAPCALPAAFIADPPLKPVIARSFELGLRGHASPGSRWRASIFRTNLKDDILFTSTTTSQGFFANVPKTRREGIELGIDAREGPVDWMLNYTWLRATYASDATLFNPLAPGDPGQPATTAVRSGSRVPAIPRHLLKAGVDYRVTPRWSIGALANWIGSQTLRGDEANRYPALKGYALLNLRTDYRLTPQWRLFGRLDNVFDKRYSSMGMVNHNGFEPDGSLRPVGAGVGPVERFVSPGAPRTLMVGVEFRQRP